MKIGEWLEDHPIERERASDEDEKTLKAAIKGINLDSAAGLDAWTNDVIHNLSDSLIGVLAGPPISPWFELT